MEFGPSASPRPCLPPPSRFCLHQRPGHAHRAEHRPVSLLGTTYGGNGTQNFNLPDTRGPVIIGAGQGPGGLSGYQLGQMGGAETVTLTVNQMPMHNHVATTSVAVTAAALRWMQTAAQANNAEAQYRFGLMLRDGIGQAADARCARFWLESAAAQGWLPAYLPTAELYWNAPADPEAGMLPATDLAKAYLWLAAASRRLPGGAEAETARVLLARVLERMPET